MQENKQEHFIKNIEIKNFKCFENFKAEGFGRVNLIGGKNNVGKTAFMEACFLLSMSKRFKRIRSVEKKIIESSIIIELNRNPITFLLEEWLLYHDEFEVKYIDTVLKTDDFTLTKDSFAPSLESYKLVLKRVYRRNHPPQIENLTFISMNTILDDYLNDFIGEMKLKNRENELNSLLKKLFDIEKIDVIKNTVMLKNKKGYLNLSEFGDGLKHFLSIVLSLYLNENKIIYLDEIENGIHHTNLDTLWEIILTISKEQNVQVFATTHSKECIESYARVAKKLEDEDIRFIELGRNKNNELDSIVMNSEMFLRFIKLGNEVRGW